MILLPILALVIGAMIAYFLRLPAIQGVSGLYLAVACLAGLDTVFGGFRSGLEAIRWLES